MVPPLMSMPFVAKAVVIVVSLHPTPCAIINRISSHKNLSLAITIFAESVLFSRSIRRGCTRYSSKKSAATPQSRHTANQSHSDEKFIALPFHCRLYFFTPKTRVSQFKHISLVNTLVFWGINIPFQLLCNFHKNCARAIRIVGRFFLQLYE